MTLHTNISNAIDTTVFSTIRRKTRIASRSSATLSPRELRKIVAELLG